MMRRLSIRSQVRGAVAILAFIFSLLLVVSATASASDLVVANAHATVPEPYENATAYFVIQNKGGEPRTIVGGTCAGCDWVAIHRAVLKNGMMDSEKLDAMEIPAGGAVAFVPRGLSLELVGLSELAAGESVTIELEFKDGEKLKFDAKAREN